MSTKEPIPLDADDRETAQGLNEFDGPNEWTGDPNNYERNNVAGAAGEVAFKTLLTDAGIPHEWTDDAAPYDFDVEGMGRVDVKTRPPETVPDYIEEPDMFVSKPAHRDHAGVVDCYVLVTLSADTDGQYVRADVHGSISWDRADEVADTHPKFGSAFLVERDELRELDF